MAFDQMSSENAKRAYAPINMGRSSSSAHAEQASLRQAHTHRRRNPLSVAASLKALESIESTSEASVDGCFIAKKSVESFAIRNGVLSNGGFPYIRPPPLTQLFVKGDCICNGKHSKDPERICGLNFWNIFDRPCSFTRSWTPFRVPTIAPQTPALAQISAA